MCFERLTIDYPICKALWAYFKCIVYLTALTGRLDPLELILQSRNTESWE